MRILTIFIVAFVVWVAFGQASHYFSKIPQIHEKISKTGLLIDSEKEKWEKLEKIYCIAYGNPQAPVHVIEFFSFQCPHCIQLFRSDFEMIKKELIDTGKIYFEFHPIPQDLPTAQAMICFENLTEGEKQLFLEVIFEEATPTDPDLMAELMKAAMRVFEKPIVQLADSAYLEKHKVFEKIFRFIKQEKVLAVPTVEVNGRLFAEEIPDYQFIHSFVGIK